MMPVCGYTNVTAVLRKMNKRKLRTQLEDFISHWMVHGKELLSSFELRYNRFIVIGDLS